PFVALRTLKSEVATNLEPDQIEILNEQDPLWLTNGQWGVIQFVIPEKLNNSGLTQIHYI
ncbi:MAG: hypothetical protein O4751_12545, partial [Trichodesmium sp. St2_bin6]|nr:hypothetical protein [Trichodesmium sp. St2_bin6]